jgi:hypothetical protein
MGRGGNNRRSPGCRGGVTRRQPRRGYQQESRIHRYPPNEPRREAGVRDDSTPWPWASRLGAAASARSELPPATRPSSERASLGWILLLDFGIPTPYP